MAFEIFRGVHQTFSVKCQEFKFGLHVPLAVFQVSCTDCASNLGYLIVNECVIILHMFHVIKCST